MGGGAALETPPHLEWKGRILTGEGVRGRGGAAFETPPHLEWKARILIVNHQPPPQCRAPCMQVNWGHWGGGEEGRGDEWGGGSL